MSRNTAILVFLVFALLPATAISARHRNRGSSEAAGQPGRFDYYVLSLSWSPEYCAGSGGSDPAQCGAGRQFAFVVHGLWPQYNDGGWPKNCVGGSGVDSSIVTKMLSIMPSPRLVEHEWDEHGKCSGQTPQNYFELVTRAYQRVKIPGVYIDPQNAITVAPADLKQQFRSANQEVPRDGITVSCSGRFLSEVRLCFDKNLTGRSCGPDVRDRCSVAQATLLPVRARHPRQ
jgi:ribonuclease T2